MQEKFSIFSYRHIQELPSPKPVLGQFLTQEDCKTEYHMKNPRARWEENLVTGRNTPNPQGAQHGVFHENKGLHCP